MALTRSKSSRASTGGKSPLESERRELAAKESELQARIAEIQQTISDAPRRAAETAERERESILNATRGQHRHRSTLVDTRYAVEAPRRKTRTAPTLRSERQAARRQALALLALLGAVLAWAACTYLQ